MQFPQRDLTTQFISNSYQDVLQRYATTGSNVYILDALGYSVLAIPTLSLGGTVLTQDQTASYSETASYAFNVSPSETASYSLFSEFTNTSSYSLFSEFSDTSSVSVYSNFAESSSISDKSISSSFADNGLYKNISIVTNSGNSFILTSFMTNSYENVFVDFGIRSGSNSRCGTIFGCFNGNNVVYTEYSTVDIGDTSDVTMSMDLSNSYVRVLVSTVSSNNWTIKTSTRYL